MNKLLLSFLSVLVLATTCFAGDYTKNLNKHERVQDTANVFSSSEKESILSVIRSYESRNQGQLAVVTLKSLEGDEISEAGIKVARFLGVGKKDQNNGILVLLAMKEKKVRIEVGSGLEGAYPDLFAKRAIDEAVTMFKQKKFPEGIIYILNDISVKTSQEFPQAERDKAIAEKKAQDEKDKWFWFWVVVIVLAIVIIDFATLPWKEFLIIGFLFDIAMCFGGCSGGSSRFSGGGFSGGGSGGDW